MMKVTFVYRNGKKYTVNNVDELSYQSGGGNIISFTYERDVNKPIKEDIVIRRPQDGLIIRKYKMFHENYAEQVSIKVDKSQLSYVIVEASLHESEFALWVPATKHKQISIIPALDYFTPDNIQDVLKTIS